MGWFAILMRKVPSHVAGALAGVLLLALWSIPGEVRRRLMEAAREQI